MPRLLILLSVVAICIACKEEETDLTDREITNAVLAAMALPQEEFGAEFFELELDDGSGYQNVGDAVGDAFDKEDERADLDRFGWRTSYQEAYFSSDGSFNGDGLLGGGTSVAFYETAEGAADDWEDELTDAERDVDKSNGEVTLEEFETFDTEELADDAIGLRFTLSIDGAERQIYATAVVVRRGRLIGGAVIYRPDDDDVSEDVEDLARRQDERIVAVLRGEIEAGNTPTLQPTHEPTPFALGGFRTSNTASVIVIGITHGVNMEDNVR